MVVSSLSLTKSAKVGLRPGLGETMAGTPSWEIIFWIEEMIFLLKSIPHRMSGIIKPPNREQHVSFLTKMDDEETCVNPGDVITENTDFMRGHGTYQVIF